MSVRQLDELTERLTANKETDLAKALALESFIAGQTYNPTSATGHTSRHLIDLFGGTVIESFDERFAAGFGVMARLAGLPSRVVVGYRAPTDVDGSVEVKAGDIEAWVEIAFEEIGWVPFDARPERSTATTAGTRPQVGDAPRSAQPPAPESRQTTPTLPPSPTTVVEQETGTASLLLIGLGSVVLFLGAVLFVIIAAKGARRRRRRQRGTETDRILGAWNEVIDRAVDAGANIDPGSTIRQTVSDIELATPSSRTSLQLLGVAAERSAFSSLEPKVGSAEASWELADDVLAGINEGTVGRAVVAINPRSLRSQA